MNIVQIHERVEVLIDEVKSARFEPTDIDKFINGATENIVRERYDQTRILNHSDAFQRTQRLRDELSGLVKSADTDGSLVYSNNIVQVKNVLSDYRYSLSIKVRIAGVEYSVEPDSYDKKNENPNSPFRRVRKGSRPRIYYIEKGNNIELIHAWEAADIQYVKIDYLADPITVYHGDEYYDNFFPLPSGAAISTNDDTVYSGTDYRIGAEFTSTGGSMAIGSSAVLSFVNTDLPNSMHEELSRRAAFDILVSIGKHQEAKAILETIVAN